MKKLYLVAETCLSEALSKLYFVEGYFSIFRSSMGIGRLDTKSLLETKRASEAFGKRHEYRINRFIKLLNEIKPKVIFYEMFDHEELLEKLGYKGEMVLLDGDYEPIKPILDVEKKMCDSEKRMANLSNKLKVLKESDFTKEEKIKRRDELSPEMMEVFSNSDVISAEYEKVVAQTPINERERREFWARKIMRMYKEPSFMIYAPCNFNDKEEFTLESLSSILIENGFELVYVE
jgi:hypothetical protein